MKQKNVKQNNKDYHNYYMILDGGVISGMNYVGINTSML